MITFALALLFCLIVFSAQDEREIRRQRMFAAVRTGSIAPAVAVSAFAAALREIEEIAARGTLSLSDLRRSFNEEFDAAMRYRQWRKAWLKEADRLDQLGGTLAAMRKPPTVVRGMPPSARFVATTADE